MTNSSALDMLVTQTWQVSAVAVAVWLLVRLWGRDQPHLAHCLWALVLLKCLTPPVWSSPVSAFSWIESHFVSQAHLRPAIASSQRGPAAEPGIAPWPAIHLALANSERAQPLLASRSYSAAIEQGAPAKQSSNAGSWRAALLSTWLAGSGLSLLVACVRLALFSRYLQAGKILRPTNPRSKFDAHLRGDIEASPHRLEQLTQALAKQLGVRQRVTTCYVEAAVGPAVFGLWRPTIVLPALIVRGKADDELQPLIAHELVHIRRGDLWWALVQTLATCLFWFHPLIWLAGNRLTRESERSCDEETIASLGCTPAAYARSLLDVLEKKQRLRVAPAVPGVRPVNITRNRLERIMRLGQGSRAATPLWVWLVLMCGLAIVLPGGAWLAAQEHAPQPTRLPPAALAAVAPQATGPWADRWEQAQLEVGDLLDSLEAKYADRERAKAALLSLVPQRTPEQINAEAAQYGVIMGGTPIHQIDGNTLKVFETREQIELCKSMLSMLREFGFEQAHVDVRMITIPSELMDELGIDWHEAQAPTEAELSPKFDPIFKRLPGLIGAVQSASATAVGAATDGLKSIEELTTPETQLKTFTQVIAHKQVFEILKLLRSDDRASMQMAPQCTMFNGQTATILACVERPFVTDMQPITAADGSIVGYQPLVRVTREGTTLNMRPVMKPSEMVDFAIAINVREVTGVEQVSFQGQHGQDLTVQQPTVVNRTMRAKATLPNGASLLISSCAPSAGTDGDMVTLIIASCAIVGSEAEREAQSQIPALQAEAQAAAEREWRDREAKRAAEPDLAIWSHKPANGQHYDELLSALQRVNDTKVEIHGHVDYCLESDRIEIHAESMTWGSPQDDECRIYGDVGSLSFHQELDGPDCFQGTFSGHVKLRLGDVEASADKLLFTGNYFEFAGNVRLTSNCSEPQAAMLSADLIHWQLDEQIFEVRGNGVFSQPISGRPAVELRADGFRWKSLTNELQTLP